MGNVKTNYFLSDKVIDELINGKKDQKLNASRYVSFMIFVKKKLETIYVKDKTIIKIKEAKLSIAGSFEGVDSTRWPNIEGQELNLKMGSFLRSKKTPKEDVEIIIDPEEEKETKDKKGYSINVVSTENFLRICGLEWPLKKDFMDQLKKISVSKD